MLDVRDQSTASLGNTENTFSVRVPGESISVRELIRSRVTQEVEEYNRRKPEVFRLLVQPVEAERTLNGFRLPRLRRIDPQEQFEKALEAFDGNGFVILVDDKQVEDLDAQIDLRADTSVTFLKLVPLVGG
jgi:hypothetical protein